MDAVLNYTRDMKIPNHMRRRVEAHYLKLWETKAIYNEKEILDRLPNDLSQPIVEFLYEDIMGSAALFSQLMEETCPHGREILVKIAMELRHEVATPNTIILNQGEYGSKMYLIGEGEVDIYRTTLTSRMRRGANEGGALKRARGRRTAVTQSYPAPFPETKQLSLSEDELAATHNLKEGDRRVRLGRLGQKGFFGERAVMRTAGSSEHSARAVRMRTVVARHPCSFHVLEKEDLENLRITFPKLMESMGNIEQGLTTPFDSYAAVAPDLEQDLMGQLLAMKEELATQKAENEKKLDLLIAMVGKGVSSAEQRRALPAGMTPR